MTKRKRVLEPGAEGSAVDAKSRNSMIGRRKIDKRFACRTRSGALLFLLLFMPFLAVMPDFARAKLVIDVNDPSLVRMPIAVGDFISDQPGIVNGAELARILKNDLYLTGLFQLVEIDPALPYAANGGPDFQKMSEMGIQALVSGQVHVQGDQLVLEARLYDVALQKQELGKRFTAGPRQARQIAHRLGDRIMGQLTGIPGCFSTRIAFAGAGNPRELFTMDFDGHDLRQLTNNGSINLSPRWSPDGRSLLFTSYMRGRPETWWLETATGRQALISGRPGLNAAARYAPDGREIALSLNHEGIPKIFIISPQGNILKRLTNGRGNDISPSWSPDRSTIAYVSDQAGTPQIYLIPVTGGQPRRLTFESNYATDPDWSPRGDLLTFTARIEGRFQICAIRTDGTDMRVLTREGSNQAPAWSPDGRMIVFGSNRDGQSRIWIMDARGVVQAPISPVPGKAPAWGPEVR
ncbi:MAG: Tol-Pal system beta propeller repeat protein TolB [Deltaproteobacteria bacterium]|nr:Tol-Pal system beta propeller repeat protein TolB [Deltaproteobacteria bacterium]